MAAEKQIWGPLCTKYISSWYLRDGDNELDETHLEFCTEDGSQFILKLSSLEVGKLWERLSMLLKEPGFPSDSETGQQH